MDPRLIRGLTVLLGVALYAGARYIIDDAEVAAYVRELGVGLIAAQAFMPAGTERVESEIAKFAP